MEFDCVLSWLQHRHARYVIGVFGVTLGILVARLGLNTTVQLLFWCGVLVISIRTYGLKKVSLSILAFLIYCVLPLYLAYKLSPYILFSVKFIFCLVAGTACMIGVLNCLTWKTPSEVNIDTSADVDTSAVSHPTFSEAEETGEQTEMDTQLNSNPPQLLLQNSTIITSNGVDFPEDLTPSSSCVICQVNSKCVVFLPCAHLCVCKECRNTLLESSDKCPMCRATINDTLLVYP